METFAWVGVFVQVGTVELGQAMAVGREMGRNPVEDHAQAGLAGPPATKNFKVVGLPKREVGA